MTLEISAWIRDLSTGKDTEFDFPTTLRELEQSGAITPGQDWIIVGYDSNTNIDFGENPDFDKMNRLIELCEDIPDEYIPDLMAAFDGLDDAIRVIENGEYHMYPVNYAGLFNRDESLGYYIIDEIYGGPENMSKELLEQYFDFESFGRNARIEASMYEGDDYFVEIE